jgi:hypothetical protein
LKDNVTDILPPNRGEVVRLEGYVGYAVKYDSIYLCKMQTERGTAEVFTPSIPQAWEQHFQVQEETVSIIPQRVAAFGVYIKNAPSGLYLRNRLVFVAPAIEWYPDTWLGNLGFNVASFDQVPVSRITELDQNNEETNRRLFKFTEADQEPFYGLLRVASATAEGWLEEEAKKQHAESPFTVTDLFNRPSETRGKPILLRGLAKRIIPTPVTNSEVQSLFGIDHYYQIYLLTNQSQGNPIVVCVRSLPEGMPVGDAVDFAVPMSVAAIPYKLWIYETSKGPHYAPILVGREPVWHPQAASPSFTNFTFTVFFTLVLIWFACRFWARRQHLPRRTRRNTEDSY